MDVHCLQIHTFFASRGPIELTSSGAFIRANCNNHFSCAHILLQEARNLEKQITEACTFQQLIILQYFFMITPLWDKWVLYNIADNPKITMKLRVAADIISEHPALLTIFWHLGVYGGDLFSVVGGAEVQEGEGRQYSL